MDNKFVIVINADLAIGLAANTAAVLALSVGAKHPDLIGKDITDASGRLHLGITTIPIPVLVSNNKQLIEIVHKLTGSEVELVSFSKIAQSIHTYEEYAKELGQTPTDQVEYSGIALFGPIKSVNSLVGSLPRLK